ncbi:MAG: ATP-binding protein, partial [Oscillospiraceae bacterium]|nr:ATP-binding protein [Oscillospiraceae bacterium]
MSFEFKPAERRKAKARLALMGVTGAGKTLGALYIAYGLTGDWGKVTVIDTEHDRALFYANRKDLNTGAFLHTTLDAPYSPERYKEAAATAAKLVGADGCVIIDNFSHAWNQEGGVLDIKEGITRNPAKRANDFSAWN